MSTVSMVRKNLKPLFAHIPDVVVIGNRLMVTPINHVWRGIVVYSHNHDKYFTAHWAITHFCNPFGNFPSDWGDLILRRSQGLRFWSEPEELQLFLGQVEQDILPMLRAIKTLDDLVDEIAASRPLPLRMRTIPEFLGVTLHAARGDLEAARIDLEHLRSKRSWWCQPPFDEYVPIVIESLGPLLDTDDREGIARQLAEWEALRISKNKGFEKIWERTPFPLETLSYKPTLPGTG